MFTQDQIDTATSKVRSGADYPALVQELKNMGVVKYDHFVADGSNIYYGHGNYSLKIQHPQAPISVNDHSLAEGFKYALKTHQAGKTDYPTFCRQAAETGVEKWTSDLSKMTVAYADKSGKIIFEEAIPSL